MVSEDSRYTRAYIGERGVNLCSVRPLLEALGPVVYAIRVAGTIKIGYTRNLAARSASLGGMHNILAWRRGSLLDERHIHERLRGQAVRGREYYSPTPEVLSVVNGMRSDLGQEPIVA